MKDSMINEIIAKEWEMFSTVNGNNRVDCQENPVVFAAMRRGQFSAWSDEAVESYLDDVKLAEKEGRNIAREKYIRMMETTDPMGYAAFSRELPPVSEEKNELTLKIWGKLLDQTIRMRDKYPAIAMAGRPLRSGEAGEAGGWASVETYQVSELKTYSEKTLQCLWDHLNRLEADGIDLAMEIQRNSILNAGYKSMEEAEQAIAFQFIQSFGGGECTTCGAIESLATER